MGGRGDGGGRRRIITSEELVEEGKRKAVKAWHKVLPFGAQVLASAAAYSVGLTATQLVGLVFRVSCATPVLGPAVGLLGVGFANALAGQASKHTRKLLVDKASPNKPGFWEAPDPEDVVLDALLGAAIFKAMGGRFSSLLPSDLAKPGALAFESIPAKATNSEDYASAGVKRELARIFRRDGCHHCGSRRGPVIGDHMPPNKILQASARDKLQAWVVEVPVVGKMAELLAGGGRRGRGQLQRFFPQCQRCSIKQAGAMRGGKRVLVLHLHMPRGRAEHLSGVFVGLRYNVPALSASADGRRSARWASLTLTAAAAAEPSSSSCVIEEHPAAAAPGPAGGLVFNDYLQQLPPMVVPEAGGAAGHAPQAWGSSNNSSSHSPRVLAVAPLTEAPASNGWHQQQHHHQHHASKGGHHAKAGPGGRQQQHGGRQQRTLSGAGGGDEVAQQQRGGAADQAPDAGAPYADAHSAGLMAPDYAAARAAAAFDRHFAPTHVRY